VAAERTRGKESRPGVVKCVVKGGGGVREGGAM
jgi:hypothetical protein